MEETLTTPQNEQPNRSNNVTELLQRHGIIRRLKTFNKLIKDGYTIEQAIAEIKQQIADEIKEAGVRDINVATERGDIFDLRIDQMAEEVWGKDNQYYFLYKRTSDVVHGQWRVIAKYHLAKSFNPMHNGLYWYNDNENHYCGRVKL